MKDFQTETIDSENILWSVYVVNKNIRIQEKLYIGVIINMDKYIELINYTCHDTIKAQMAV